MGIDSTVFIYSATMFDQKGQSFNNNRWFSNQVDQPQFMMNAVNDMNGANLPLGTSALLGAPDFADFGNSSPSRLPSNRSASTDSSFDPDGPPTDNGYGNCQSPDLEENVYDRTMGTPNSFIADPSPESPDMFSEQRERQFSTSSSTFTYSPYSPHEEVMIPPPQAPCVSGAPALDRQTSLAMVEEVLGPVVDCSQPLLLFSKDESPIRDCSEDSCLPPYPSPSFMDHFNASNNLAQNYITSSQGEEFFASYCGQEAPLGYQCGGSPTAESSPAPASNSSNNNETQSVQSPSTQENVAATSTEETATVEPYYRTPFVAGTIERQSTNFSDLITDSMPTNSLDVDDMMQDFVNTLPPSQPQQIYTTLNVAVLSVGPLQESLNNNTEQKVIEQPITSLKNSNQSNNYENIKPCTSSDTGETNISSVRRERNNAACRQSRKRRKNKKMELESQVGHFTQENEELRVQIEQLEVECKRVKTSILSHMSSNISR